jgi:hypothetical protein
MSQPGTHVQHGVLPPRQRRCGHQVEYHQRRGAALAALAACSGV